MYRNRCIVYQTCEVVGFNSVNCSLNVFVYGGRISGDRKPEIM